MLEVIPSRNEILADCEIVIEKAQSAFRVAGEALNTINADRLWEIGGYADFDDYCQKRWGFKKAYGYRLIGAAKLIRELEVAYEEELAPETSPSISEESPIESGSANADSAKSTTVDSESTRLKESPRPTQSRKRTHRRPPPSLPTIEKHALELAKLPRTLHADAWRRVVETAPNGTVTAAHVQAVVNAIKEEQKTGSGETDKDDLISRDQAVQDARLRADFSDARSYHIGHMLRLKPDALAQVWSQQDRVNVQDYFSWARRWMDEVESALEKTPLVMMKGGKAQ